MQFFQRQFPGDDREGNALGIAQSGDSCIARKQQIDLRHGLMAVPMNAALLALKDGALHRRSEGMPCSGEAEMGQGECDGVASELRKAHFAQRRNTTHAAFNDSEQTCVVNGEIVPAQVRHIHHDRIAVLGDAVEIPLREQKGGFFSQTCGFHLQKRRL